MSEFEIMDLLEEEQSGWRCTDDSAAQWAVQKIKEAQADNQRWADFYAEQLEKVKAANQRTIDNLTARLAEYFETVPHKSTKTADKYSLPGADLVLKHQGLEIVHDDDALLPWVKANHPDCIKVKESVAWANVKARLSFDSGVAVDKTTGEVVTGVNLVERPDVFEIKIK